MELMIKNCVSLEIKGMHTRFNTGSFSQVAFVPSKLFDQLKEDTKQHLYITVGGKKTFLKPKPMPTWDPYYNSNVIRMHEDALAALNTNYGEFCRASLVNTLPELDYVSIRVEGLQGKVQNNLKNVLKNYLVGNAIQENSYLPLSIGFCRELNVEMRKTYPFSKGVIGKKTRLDISNQEK
ncbi:MAG: hypothetical protein ACFFCS_25990 [Candidatus Hodarchaeota archaeon]